MKVEVLFFDGCPNFESLLPHLRALLNAGEAEDAAIALVRVEDADTAEAERFLGSPTIRIDGQDVEPGVNRRTDFGVKCRLFATPDGLRGLPADERVLRALERARTADSLRDRFPARDDPPLALALVRLLARGKPVTDAVLAVAAGRAIDEVAAKLARWPSIERDPDDAVIGFSGVTLRPSDHSFELDHRHRQTRCAWDRLFLPGMLGATARARPDLSGVRRRFQLAVAPDRDEYTAAPEIHVCFPPLASTNTADITGTFCSHVRFLSAPTRHTRGCRRIPAATSSTWRPRSSSGAGPPRR